MVEQVRIALEPLAGRAPDPRVTGDGDIDITHVVIAIRDTTMAEEFVRELRKALPRRVAGAMCFVAATPAPDHSAPWAEGLNSSTAVAAEHGDPRVAGRLTEPGDARWFIWCKEETQAESYDGRLGVVGILTDSVAGFAWEVNRHLAGDLRPASAARGRVVSEASGPVSPRMVTGERQSMPAPVRPAGPPPATPEMRGIHGKPAPERLREPVPGPPMALLSNLLRHGGAPGAREASAVGGEGGRPPRASSHRRGRDGTPGRPRLLPHLGGRGRHDRAGELERAAARLISRGSTVVLVGGRKGGGGKTMTAAAVAVAAARALEPHGGSVIVVDQNITNPDVGAELGTPDRAPTVRRVVDALDQGRIPAEPVVVSGTPLHALPEARRAGGYGRAEVDRLCAHLRRRYTVIVVDLANTLPSIVAGPAGAVFYYWLQHANVFVAPVGMDRNAWLAMAETLDDIEEVVEESQGRLHEPPAVVPILVSRGGERAFEIPWFARARGCLADAGVEFVEIPQLIELQTRSWHESRPPMDEVSPEAEAASERLMLTIEGVVARQQAADDD